MLYNGNNNDLSLKQMFYYHFLIFTVKRGGLYFLAFTVIVHGLLLMKGFSVGLIMSLGMF